MGARGTKNPKGGGSVPERAGVASKINVGTKKILYGNSLNERAGPESLGDHRRRLERKWTSVKKTSKRFQRNESQAIGKKRSRRSVGAKNEKRKERAPTSHCIPEPTAKTKE